MVESKSPQRKQSNENDEENLLTSGDDRNVIEEQVGQINEEPAQITTDDEFIIEEFTVVQVVQGKPQLA